MRSEAELRVDANRNFGDAYRVLVRHTPGGEIRERDGLLAFTSRLPIPVLNGCIVTGAVPRSALTEALRWLADAGVSHSLWVDGASVGDRGLEMARDVATAAGFDPHADYPGMVLHRVPPAPPPAPGVEVVPVDPSDAHHVDEYLGVWEADGVPRVVAERLFSTGFITDPDVRLFTGRLDGVGVGTSAAIRGGDIAGVVSVATLPAARRRGVGTAVSWAAAEAARTWGCETSVLQASAMGESVYRAMGFRTVVTYLTLVRRAST
jgi:GNAT superfamily N-acetyltransferase